MIWLGEEGLCALMYSIIGRSRREGNGETAWRDQRQSLLLSSHCSWAGAVDMLARKRPEPNGWRDPRPADFAREVMRMIGVRRVAASSLRFATLAVLGKAGPAWSHAEMVKSSPAAGAVLTKAPPEVRAWFNDELAVKGSTLRLYDAHSKLLGTGGVDPKVPKHDVMRIASPHLAAGPYLVRWHAISADDNKVTEGSFRFSIKGAAAMSLPPLQVIQPANRATVENPVTLTFDTPADMMKFTMGGM